MASPAIDYFHPTLTGPNSIVDRFLTKLEEPTGTNIFELTKPEFPTPKTKYALWQFVVNDIPLSAFVSLQGGQWFAELDWLNLFGEGASPSDAIGNLSEHIEHFIEYYSEKRADELTDHAKETRKPFS